MAERVNKPFKTVNRKFNTGDSVTAEDIVGDRGIDHWKDRGFVGEQKKSSFRFEAPKATE